MFYSYRNYRSLQGYNIKCFKLRIYKMWRDIVDYQKKVGDGSVLQYKLVILKEENVDLFYLM